MSRRATYRAIQNGHIPVIRLGRRILVPTAPLDQLLDLRSESDAHADVEREAS